MNPKSKLLRDPGSRKRGHVNELTTRTTSFLNIYPNNGQHTHKNRCPHKAEDTEGSENRGIKGYKCLTNVISDTVISCVFGL